MSIPSEFSIAPSADNLPVARLGASGPPGQQPTSAPSAAAHVVQVIGQIFRITERLFPGPASVEYSFDPENPTEEWLVFDVTAHGEYKDYREKRNQWHEEVEKLVPGTLGEFRLCVMPQR